MSKLVKLYDDTEIHITDNQAARLTIALNGGTDGYVTIGDSLIKKSNIAKIVPGGKTEVDVIPESNRIAPPDNRGEESPAKNAIQEYLQAHGTMRGYRAN